MSSGERDLLDFASGDGSQTADVVLQQLASDVQLFSNNVINIERKTRLLNTAEDTTYLRKEIVQLVRDTAQLAKYADGSLRKLRTIQQSRRLSTSEKLQFDRLLNTFSSSGGKFQNLQQITADIESDMLTRARTHSVDSYSSRTESEREDSRLVDHDVMQESHHVQRMAQLTEESVVVEEREREMRQLEHDIVDINEIFRDMGALVHDQGDMIDNIEAHVETAGSRVEQGNKQLVKAVRFKRCSRKLTICIIVILTVVLVLIIAGILIALKVTGIIGGSNK